MRHHRTAPEGGSLTAGSSFGLCPRPAEIYPEVHSLNLSQVMAVQRRMKKPARSPALRTLLSLPPTTRSRSSRSPRPP